ncbi:MAG: SDR family oxidoreductase [Deltaproteobacteria bacterium]|nr:SDR family oxidoreductase [Deltaproteobacteria bacterium]
MTDRLKGKLALVSGGSRGIGSSIAEAYAREGARVIIASRKQEGLDSTAAEINAKYPDSIIPRACHIGHADKIEELVSWAEKEHGVPDVLVNNAGTNPYFGPLLGITPQLWDKTFDVNLRGFFEMTRQLALRWQANETKGSIVSIASIAGLRAAPLQGVYGMTKAGVISMTMTLAVELGPNGIRANAIAPGVIDTKLSAMLVSNPDIIKIFTEHTALKRYGQPEEVAELAVYLGSDESTFVTGQTFCVDGGFTIA